MSKKTVQMSKKIVQMSKKIVQINKKIVQMNKKNSLNEHKKICTWSLYVAHGYN